MSAQLDQILAYLDKEGVTEIMIGMGQPASLRRRGQLIKITNTPVTRKQLDILLQGTSIAAHIPERDGTSPRADIDVGTRMIRVLATRRGEEIILRIEKSPPGATATSPPSADGGPSVRFGSSAARPVAPAVSPAPPAPAPAPTPVRPAPSPPIEIELELEPEHDGMGMPRRPARVTRTPKTRMKTGTTKAPPLEARTKTETPPPPVAPRARSRTRAPKPAPSFLSETAARATPASKAKFAAILATAIERGATDLHIASGRTTSIRVLGELVPIDNAGPQSHIEVETLLIPLLDPDQIERLAESGYVDLAIAAPTGGRLRTNISRAAGGIKGTFRIARAQPATLDELGLPKELAKVVNHHQGLVVIAGPSGHGKTTTLSALVDLVNAHRPHHIITVEDPIEIIYPRKVAVVSQREVGPHTRSFAAALKGSLREDPDVIVIGELRDRETVEIALTASETGHLVIATMSTPSAAKTIDRLVDMFPPEDQQQVRASIAGALRAIVSQRLLPRADGRGVVAAIELVTGVLPLAAMIRDDKLYQLPSLLQRGKAFGMIRMDDTLVELVRSGQITPEIAIATSENKREIASTLRGGGTQAMPKLEAGAPPHAAPVGTAPQAPSGKSRIASLFGMGKKDKEP